MIAYFAIKFYIRFIFIFLAMIFYPIVIFKMPMMDVIANGIMWGGLLTILVMYLEFRYYNLWALYDNLGLEKHKLFLYFFLQMQFYI